MEAMSKIPTFSAWPQLLLATQILQLKYLTHLFILAYFTLLQMLELSRKIHFSSSILHKFLGFEICEKDNFEYDSFL